jgi:uncharacterized membrane protein
MIIPIVLAKVLGLICIFVGLSMFSKKNIETVLTELEHNRALLWLYGFFAFTIGLVVLSIFNTWGPGWMALITLVGWLILLKGAVIMLFPDNMIALYKKAKLSSIGLWACAIVIILGLYLLYK